MLEDKSVFITGAGRGIGRQIALACAEAGARVVAAARTKKQIESVTKKTGGLAVELDVADPKSVERAVRRAGRIDVLVNNAGVFSRGRSVADLTLEDWDRVMNTNLRGVFLMCRAVLPQMIKRRDGDIVMISSTSGKRSIAGNSVYAASKHGLNGFTHSLVYETRKHNIRVITVSPSSVELPESGPMRDNRLQAPDVAQAIVAALSLPRRALVRDIEMWATNP